ncbi:MAG: alcohol dehydrogenase catalytic domain-containing protein, partial [Armatimonadetes bacterium]|nr:alcohol dehydrogenase catalytic domain-containing protein [Armatimonadota bacterium]
SSDLHETAGIVTATGPDTRTTVGTPGVIFLMDFCGECRSCRQGFTNQCLRKRADMGFTHDGGYGPYELIHENIFFPVDPDLPFSEATLLLDIMGTGGHALRRARLLHPDIQSVLITGAGPIGLGVLAMARLLLGEDLHVFITDRIPYRLKLAERLGGRPIPLEGGTVEAGLRSHGRSRVDLAVDTSGKEEARRAGMDLLDKRGALVCVGHGEGLNLTVSPDLIAPERAVLGSEYFRYDELPGNLELLRAHRSYLGQIISHRFPVTEIQRAFETFWGGETGKVVVEQ